MALRYAEGVIMAGDRRATEGYSIAYRAIDKVFPADGHSGVAIAGAAGPAVEMVRLFQTELEHYEKVEGVALSLEGKANQLGGMIRRNLPMAMQGLAVVPIYAGYDLRRRIGRIFKYDLTGGRYEEGDFHATGSGGRDARTTIKLGYRRASTGPRPSSWPSRASTRRPTRTRPPAGPTSSGASTPPSPPSPPTGSSGWRTPRSPSASASSSQRKTVREGAAPDEHAVLRRARSRS